MFWYSVGILQLADNYFKQEFQKYLQDANYLNKKKSKSITEINNENNYKQANKIEAKPGTGCKNYMMNQNNNGRVCYIINCVENEEKMNYCETRDITTALFLDHN